MFRKRFCAAVTVLACAVAVIAQESSGPYTAQQAAAEKIAFVAGAGQSEEKAAADRFDIFLERFAVEAYDAADAAHGRPTPPARPARPTRRPAQFGVFVRI